MIDVRAELGRLILDGLNGRPLKSLFQALKRRFGSHGETLVWDTFTGWVSGEKFPATQLRQTLLGDEIGGPCGEAIKRLPGPSFRGYRRRMSKEAAMSSTPVSEHFPLISYQDAEGRWHKAAKIVCSSCKVGEFHERRGALESGEYFRKHGWEVARSREHDVCPTCLRGRKVIRMSDHKKPAVEPEPEKVMGKEDARLIFRAIEPHWDDNLQRYQPGWSDVKVADENGVAVDWVRHVREDMYGGVGEDPGLTEFLAAQLSLNQELGELAKDFKDLSTSVTQSIEMQQKLFDKYREKHNKLHDRVHRLTEVANRLQPPFPQPKAG